MKKIITLIICVSVLSNIVVLSACSKQADTTQTEQSTAVQVPTEEAKIKNADAVSYIEGYSNKELGLSDDDRAKCSFMVASEGEIIDGKKYVKVIAAIKHEHKNDDGKTTFTLDTKGEYFISFDSSEVLKKDGDSYTKLPLQSSATERND
ncbi:hypothetical protein [uncultured Eubacterium sp.]|uniref:hypothetical protein n=1 Tax=uncultured Eubacterium sp. TaxID=165185 RepID=UPI0015BE9BCC|nr:hypothetical protein [uncultured Eubacterium sp.]